MYIYFTPSIYLTAYFISENVGYADMMQVSVSMVPYPPPPTAPPQAAPVQPVQTVRTVRQQVRQITPSRGQFQIYPFETKK